MSSTTSRRSVAPPEPLSVEHFARYCHALRLDNGQRFDLEDFQLEVAADIFAGISEVWMVVPEGNGKTTFMSALALYHGDYTETAFVPIGASSREQAEILYRQAEGFVFRTPGLRDRFKCQEGYRRIKCLRTGGRIQVYAADDRTADGIIPTLALLDELHRHRNLRLYRTWRGKLEKRGGQIATISTAGEPGGEFEDTRSNIRRTASSVTTTASGCHVRAEGDDIVLHDFSVPSVKQAEDMDVVAAANPRADITAGRLRKKRDSPTMTREHWLRFVCNVATAPDGNGVQPEDWDALADRLLDPDESLDGFGWIDLGWKIDTTAVGVLLIESPERRLVPAPVVIQPPVDEGDVVTAMLDFQERFPNLRGWVMDPNAGAQQMAQLLEKGSHPLQTERGVGPMTFFDHSQDNAPMGLAAARFDEAVRNGWFVHDGDRTFRKHVLNAVRKTTGHEKYRFDRPRDAQGERRKQYPIDALTGLLMGNSVAVANADAFTGPFIEVFG
jgi:phage terminase large subunit-like protein